MTGAGTWTGEQLRQAEWVRHDVTVGRTDAARTECARRGLDGMLFADPANLAYFAGIGGLGTLRPTWLLVPVEGPAAIVVPRIEREVAGASTWIDDLREWVEWPDPEFPDDWVVALSGLFAEKGLDRARIGYEAATVSVAALHRLRTALDGVEFVTADDLYFAMRLRKDPFELDIMRAGGRVQIAQLDAVGAVIADGVPEFELALAARAGGARAAANELGDRFELVSPLIDHVQMIGAGARAAFAHGRASTCRIGPGDPVQICYCGPVFLGYNIGFDRPFALGPVDAEKIRIVDTALRAHDAALQTVRPGVRASEVHAAACRVLDEAGLLGYRTHRTGRGVGAGEAEPPELKESDTTVLEPGMTFTVEPGIYVPGVAGARFGDTVAVTDAGYEMLTPAPYQWRL